MTNTSLVNEASVRAYVDMLFGSAGLAHGRFVCVRGIGEKGTGKEGVFRENLFHITGPILADEVLGHVTRWAEHGIAAYILPATLKTDNASDENVNQFTTLMVDLDSGDTNKKRDHLAKAIGWPTMIVASGGITETGNLKLHMYWALSQPTSDKARVGRLREVIAQKAGGDWQFKKPAQVVRIAGSVHGKDGKASKVEIILHDPDAVFDLDEIAGKIEAMGWMPGVRKPDENRQNVLDFTAKMPLSAPQGNHPMDFSRAAGVDLNQATGQAIAALTAPIHEGGDEDRNRWSEFSKVAGHYIHCARLGQMSVEEACEFTRGWMAAYMAPAWPEARFVNEFRAVLNHDLRTKGPMPAPKVMPTDVAVITTQGETLTPMAGLAQWDVSNWAMGEAPKRKFLVPGWIMAGVPHTLAAEGGAGKTYMALDLGLKLAAASRGSLGEVRWLGEPITNEAIGGAVVIITAEDDQNELHIRLNEIDPDGRYRQAAAGRLRVLPLVNAGGVFKLVRRDGASGEPASSQKWESLMSAIMEIRAEVGKVTAVIIDTLAATLHGEDISSQVVTEYYTEASRVCGEAGAALIVTHHIRKQKAGEPIRNADEFKESIRGSGAVQFSSRVVLGLWHAHDYSKLMKAMGEKPEKGECYRLAVVKTNNPEMARDAKVLLRSERGVLLDKSGQVTQGLAKQSEEGKAWLIEIVRHYAAHGYALCDREKSGFGNMQRTVNGVLQKNNGPLGHLTAADIHGMVDQMKEAGLIVERELGNGTTGLGLDVPDGRLAKKENRGNIAYAVRKADEVPPFNFDHWQYDPETGRLRKTVP